MGQYERHLFVCTHGEYCPDQGSHEVLRALREEVASRGLKGSIRVNKAGCFNQCGRGPMVVVYPENVWYGGVAPAQARRIIDEHLVGGRPVEEILYRMPPGPNKDGARMAEIRANRGSGSGTGES
ncbi:MAG: (2Fe-2S) ferredoxin domain-containing protein [Acidobacteria bacterium]|nr:(2Fe-2S) ferredoxin domain-containing protein [Acidobacteriota bacterium]